MRYDSEKFGLDLLRYLFSTLLKHSSFHRVQCDLLTRMRGYAGTFESAGHSAITVQLERLNVQAWRDARLGLILHILEVTPPDRTISLLDAWFAEAQVGELIVALYCNTEVNRGLHMCGLGTWSKTDRCAIGR
jgi:hypothetical protein